MTRLPQFTVHVILYHCYIILQPKVKSCKLWFYSYTIALVNHVYKGKLYIFWVHDNHWTASLAFSCAQIAFLILCLLFRGFFIVCYLFYNITTVFISGMWRVVFIWCTISWYILVVLTYYDNVPNLVESYDNNYMLKLHSVEKTFWFWNKVTR